MQSPEAAFAQGLDAVKRQQWDRAILAFEEAEDPYYQKSQPVPPALYFNLGLAHAKAGHEGIAMAWFVAYLTAAPRAPNADAVHKELKRLEAAIDEKARRIFTEALTALQRFPDPDASRWLVDFIGSRMAQAGYVDLAIETALKSDADAVARQTLRGEFLRVYAETLADARDVEAAQALLDTLASDEDRDAVWNEIAGTFQYDRDFERASPAAANIHDPAKRQAKLADIEQERPASDPASPPAPRIINWSHFIRVEQASYCKPPEERLGEVQEDASASPEKLVTDLAFSARALRECLFRIRAQDKRFSRILPAVASQ